MKRKHAFLIISVILLFGLFYKIFQQDKSSFQAAINKENTTKIKAGNLTTDYSIEQVLEDIEDLQLNTINLPVVINIENTSSNTMVIDDFSVTQAKELLEQINEKDIAIILEPYPWIANGSQYETEWNPTNKEKFFTQWEDDVLFPLIEELAIPYEIDVLNIGTSFNHMEETFEEEWLNIISSIRQKFDGFITYRTSWWKTATWDEKSQEKYQSKMRNKMFGELDFISIAAYFELTENETNTVPEIVDSLYSTTIYERGQNIKEEIENFHQQWEKPIFFGELGFPKTIYATKHPWNPYESDIINTQEQANSFQAYQQVFSQESWLIGFSLFSIGETGEDKLYYPSEETKKIIRNWS